VLPWADSREKKKKKKKKQTGADMGVPDSSDL
jgi:hypothetical protein